MRLKKRISYPQSQSQQITDIVVFLTDLGPSNPKTQILVINLGRQTMTG